MNSSKTKTRILALDLATTTGYAILLGNGKIRSGVVDFSVGKGEPLGKKLAKLSFWVNNEITGIRFDCGEVDIVMACEEPHFRGYHATHTLVGMLAVARMVCAERNVKLILVRTNTLKKHATGNGHATKEDMIARASKIARRKITSDDEADAVCLLFWAKETIQNELREAANTKT